MKRVLICLSSCIFVCFVSPVIGAVYRYVYFSRGAGTGNMSSIQVMSGNTAVLPANTFIAPNGYQFDKWYCGQSIGDVADQGSFTMPFVNVTCTAQWKWTVSAINLTWYEEDGETTLSGGASSCTYGGTISSLPTAPAKPGYHFARWKVIKPECASITDQTTCNNTSGCVYANGSNLVYKCCSIVPSCGNITDAETCENTASSSYGGYIRCTWFSAYGDCREAYAGGGGADN